MNARTLLAMGAAALVSISSFAQQAREGERPPRPDNASNAAIGGWCDALTGSKKEECLRDERRREEKKAGERAATTRRSQVTPAAPEAPRERARTGEARAEPAP